MEKLFLKTIKEAIKHWYIPLVVGVSFVIVGIISFASPLSSLLALSILFSLAFITAGLSEVVFSLANKKPFENWGWSLIFGVITILVGVLLLLNPVLSLGTLAFYIGIVILFRSIAAMSFAFDIKKYGGERWVWLLVFGVFGAIFSFILLWNPVFAGLGVVLLVALSFLFGGLFNIYFAIQLKKLHHYNKDLSPKLREKLERLQEEIKQEWGD